jgi:hypothetical protein
LERIRVLDPTAPPPEVDVDAGPPAGRLRGKTVGIRFDNTWRSFLFATDEWSRRLEAAGARVHAWEAGGRVGEEGERTRRELEEFSGAVDVAIVGLGN